MPIGIQAPAIAPSTEIIWVLGMHRSGTSALTRLLNLLGAHLSEPLLPPMEEINELGFWEHQAVVELNERLFARLGSCWYDPRPLPLDWWLDPSLDVLREEADQLLREHFTGVSLAAIKDPRLCRTIPFWLDAAYRVGHISKVLIMLRDPAEVAGSLHRRDGLPHAVTWQLWRRYVLDAEHFTRACPRSMVRYAEVLSDWQDVAGRIATELEIAWPCNPSVIKSVVAKEIRSDLHRQHAKAIALDGSETTRELDRMFSTSPLNVSRLDELRDELETAYRERPDILDALFGCIERILADQRQLFEAGQLLETRDAMIQERDARLIELEAHYQETGRLYAHAESVVKERDAQLADLEARHEETSRLYAHAESIIKERDARLADLEARHQETGRLYAHAESIVKERDAQLAELNARYQEIAQLYAHAESIVKERDAQLAELNACYQEIAQLYAHAESIVKERDTQLEELNTRYQETARLYAHAESIVKERDTQLAELNTRYQETARLYAHAESIVKERDAELAIIRAQLTDSMCEAE